MYFYLLDKFNTFILVLGWNRIKVQLRPVLFKHIMFKYLGKSSLKVSSKRNIVSKVEKQGLFLLSSLKQ